MSDVGDGASLDFAFEAVGFAEEDGGRGVAIGDSGDVHAYIICHLTAYCKDQIELLHAYIIQLKTSYQHQNKEIYQFSDQNFGLTGRSHASVR